ncbi:hypothetical protein DPMN_074384 [Dreissena polymorpha]|uniref:EGF-like domain-containing protein n=2 Tax=Dreissena polymorpha TaxID=45954 RepID=A0A9D3YIH9_DREPO|nr:hypothetical protein DPMN_074384 [Dreissena polymorpha]
MGILLIIESSMAENTTNSDIHRVKKVVKMTPVFSLGTISPKSGREPPSIHTFRDRDRFRSMNGNMIRQKRFFNKSRNALLKIRQKRSAADKRFTLYQERHKKVEQLNKVKTIREKIERDIQKNKNDPRNFIRSVGVSRDLMHEKNLKLDIDQIDIQLKVLDFNEQVKKTYTANCKDEEKGITLVGEEGTTKTFECVEMFIRASNKKDKICANPSTKCCASCKLKDPPGPPIIRGETPVMAWWNNFAKQLGESLGITTPKPPIVEKNTSPPKPPKPPKPIDPCLSYPCKNGGTCNNKPMDILAKARGFECVCQSAYTGKDCEDRKEMCSTLKCKILKDCVASLEGMLCICEGSKQALHPDNRFCLSENPASENLASEITQVIGKVSTSALTIYVIAGVSVAILIILLLTLVTRMKASSKLRDLEILYVAALDQGYKPRYEAPEMSGVWIDVVKTTLCCATSSYPETYVPPETQEQGTHLTQDYMDKNASSFVKSSAHRISKRRAKRSRSSSEPRAVMYRVDSAKSIQQPLALHTQRPRSAGPRGPSKHSEPLPGSHRRSTRERDLYLSGRKQ